MLTRVVNFFWKNSDTRVKLALERSIRIVGMSINRDFRRRQIRDDSRRIMEKIWTYRNL